MAPKVSVIVPVYKVPLDYLRECFDSLLAQTMQDCEFIVVSDGAPDAECSVCEEYATKDPRFNFFRREHAGVSATRNFGISQAQGKFLSFVDSDDWISEDILSMAYKTTEEKKCDIVFWNCVLSYPQHSHAHVIKFDIQNEKVLSPQIILDIKENLFFTRNEKYSLFIFPVCKFYRSDLIKNVLFKENLQIGEDRIFNLQVIKEELKIVYLNQDAYFYRQNENSATKRYRKNAFNVLYQYIIQMEIIANGKYTSEICNEILCKFDESLGTDYFHKNNPYSFCHNITRIKKTFFSKEFQEQIKKCNLNKLDSFFRISHYFISHRIFLWIYIRFFMKKIFQLLK